MNACSCKLAHALLRVPIIIPQNHSKQMTFIPSFWHLPPANRWVPHVVWFLPVCSCPLRFWLPLELPSPSGSVVVVETTTFCLPEVGLQLRRASWVFFLTDTCAIYDI